MEGKLFDSELKIMEALWKEGELTAGQLAKQLKEEIGWNRNTTYTVIKKCIEKGAIERREPNFVCKALVTREQVQQQETNQLIEKMFDGRPDHFFASFIQNNHLTPQEIQELKKMIHDLK